MSDTFDYRDLARCLPVASIACDDHATVEAYLRTRIEAAFVPRATDQLIGETMSRLSAAAHAATARAEAAEARNKVLEHIVRRYMASTPEHDFSCGMGALHNCTCDLHAVNELTRQALGGEHER